MNSKFMVIVLFYFSKIIIGNEKDIHKNIVSHLNCAANTLTETNLLLIEDRELLQCNIKTAIEKIQKQIEKMDTYVETEIEKINKSSEIKEAQDSAKKLEEQTISIIQCFTEAQLMEKNEFLSKEKKLEAIKLFLDQAQLKTEKILKLIPLLEGELLDAELAIKEKSNDDNESAKSIHKSYISIDSIEDNYESIEENYQAKIELMKTQKIKKIDEKNTKDDNFETLVKSFLVRSIGFFVGYFASKFFLKNNSKSCFGLPITRIIYGISGASIFHTIKPKIDNHILKKRPTSIN